jgi:hypothetical protein
VNFENWHEIIDSAFLYLHKEFGFPVRLTVSPHFCYQAAQWPCQNAINMLLNNELADKNYHNLFSSRNKNELEANFHSMSLPASISLLKELPCDERGMLKAARILNDYKIAKHYLEMQESPSRSYVQRRDNFHKVVIANNEVRPTRTFLHKDIHIRFEKEYQLSLLYTHEQKHNAQSARNFTRLYDEAFKNHYTNIIQENERLAVYQKPLQYTTYFTTDIRNLYYYSDDCTSVRDKV